LHPGVEVDVDARGHAVDCPTATGGSPQAAGTYRIAACAAATRAMGTRYGEQLT
jgi:hypothetical protein